MAKKRSVKACVKGRVSDLEGQRVMEFRDGPVNLYYAGAECPECGEPIDDDKQDGDECDGCGFVFSQG